MENRLARQDVEHQSGVTADFTLIFLFQLNIFSVLRILLVFFLLLQLMIYILPYKWIQMDSVSISMERNNFFIDE